MSTTLIQSEIKRFWESPEPEILCVKGAWGAGKTYMWNKFAKETAKTVNTPLKFYSYCSLFGVNTVDELKQSIFENLEPMESLAAPAPLSLAEKSKLPSGTRKSALTGGHKLLSAVVERVGGKAAAELVRHTTFWLVRDQVVVVDDVERKGEKLTIDEVLGLLSFLKEQRGCKCVLILNAEKLGNAKTVFDRYLEKVVDVSVLFAPTPSECADIVFGHDGVIEKRLHELCTLVQLTNIRVLTRIKKLVERIVPVLRNKDQRVVDQALRTLVLLAWVHFCPDDAPSVSFLSKRSEKRIAEMVSREVVATTPQIEAWHQLLEKLGSNDLSEFDLSLLKGIQDGYFDDFAIAELADQFERQLRENDAQRAFHAAWDVFHGGFGDDADILVSAFVLSIRGAVDFVTPSNLDSSIRLLRGLQCDAQADELISYYVDHHSGGIEFFTLRSHHQFDVVNDEKLKKVFQDKAASFSASVRSPAEVLDAVGNFRRNPGDAERLLQFDPSDLVQGLKAIRRSTAVDAVKALRENTSIAKNGQTVASNTETALAAISSESRLNALRVENILSR